MALIKKCVADKCEKNSETVAESAWQPINLLKYRGLVQKTLLMINFHRHYGHWSQQPCAPLIQQPIIWWILIRSCRWKVPKIPKAVWFLGQPTLRSCAWFRLGNCRLTLTGDRSQVQLAVSLNFACRIQLLPCARFLAPIGNLLLLGSVTIGNSTIRLFWFWRRICWSIGGWFAPFYYYARP